MKITISESAEWVEILSDFIKFYFKQMLKTSAFYLEKQKKLFLKNIFYAVVSKHAKIDPKDGAGCPNFQWRFCADQAFTWKTPN